MLKQILDFVLNEDRLDAFFIHMLWVAPVCGLGTGILLGIFKKKCKQCVWIGTIIGIMGSLISIMWFIYNAIMDHYGLDSVKGLMINLLVFTLTGLFLGLLIRYIQNRNAEKQSL